MPELWTKLLDKAEEAGREGFKAQGPLLSDEELVAVVRPVAAAAGAGSLVDGITDDVDLMEELRDAYDEGRQPYRFDMNAVVEQVQAAGVAAFVDHAGGNTATIYAGEVSRRPNMHGDNMYAVQAGSGWFEELDRRRPMAHVDEFGVGEHVSDDEQVTVVAPKDRTDAAAVAELIVTAVRAVEAKRERIEAAVNAAGEAFWAAIAAAFPEITDVDSPSDAMKDLVWEQHRAVARWLHHNVPDGGIAAEGPQPADVPTDEPLTGRVRLTGDERESVTWRFQLAGPDIDLGAAWEAAVLDFCGDREVFTRAVDNGDPLFKDQLVTEYPEILARHGLTFLPDPDEETVEDYDDVVLVSVDEPRCTHVMDDDLRCGAELDRDDRCTECPDHRQDNVA